MSTRTRKIANSVEYGLTVGLNSKYRKTSNTSRCPYNMGVHLVRTYDISSRFVWNNYDKIAWIRHRINVTKQTVSKVKIFVVYRLCNHAHLYMQKKFKMANWQCLNRRRVSNTRKLCYRKDDRAMRPTYGCPENFRDSLIMPTATFLKIFHGLLF